MAVRKTFKFTGKKVFLCDMRPGFSEDGVECALPNGNYELVIEPSQNDMRGFSLVLAGETPDGHIDTGTFTIDMARVGILDQRAFLELFDGNREALFDWSESASDSSKKSDWGGFLHHKKAGLEALYVDIGSDCECAVQSLRSGTKTVGVRVIPEPPTERPAGKRKSRQFTWAEVKCSGIADPWEFCDDWDYEPEMGDVLDNVIMEVSSVDEGDSLTFLDTENIDPDAAISTYQKRFKGITRINVFLEHSEEEDRKRLSIPNSYAIPKLGAQTTSRELAKTVLDIFKNARTWS